MAPSPDKEIPAPVRAALSALDVVRTQDADLAASLAKALPAYALRLAQSGQDVTVDLLLEAARGGPENIKKAFARAAQPCTEPRSFLERYEATFARPGAELQPRLKENTEAPDMELIKESIIYCAMNDLTRELDILLLFGGSAVHKEACQALALAAALGHSSACDILVNEYKFLTKEDINAALLAAIKYQKIETVIYLCTKGADVSLVDADTFLQLKPFLTWMGTWGKVTGQPGGATGLYGCDPALYQHDLFMSMRSALAKEGYSNGATNRLIFNAIALLQTPERVFAYVRKYGAGGDNKQPLHDAIHMINLPENLKGVDLAAWGDAVLQNGPKMARLARFCDKLPCPVADPATKKEWSYQLTFDAVSAYSYARAAEHPALSKLCLSLAIHEDTFNAALALVQTTPAHEKNIPDITIDGRRFGMPGTTLRRLATHDLRGLFLGHFTGCCQSLSSKAENGDACARDGFTSADSGFYVVEKADGEILGQTWAWRGTQGELCFDSLEAYRTRMSTRQWRAVLHEVVKELAQDASHDVTALHFGIGGKTPRHLARSFQVPATAQPRTYDGYRDSRNQRIAWRR